MTINVIRKDLMNTGRPPSRNRGSNITNDSSHTSNSHPRETTLLHCRSHYTKTRRPKKDESKMWSQFEQETVSHIKVTKSTVICRTPTGSLTLEEKGFTNKRKPLRKQPTH